MWTIWANTSPLLASNATKKFLMELMLFRPQLLSLFLVFTDKAWTILECGFHTLSSMVGAQRLGLAAEEIHWQAWDVSGPTAGPLFYKTQGTWNSRLQIENSPSSLAHIKNNFPWWIKRQELSCSPDGKYTPLLSVALDSSLQTWLYPSWGSSFICVCFVFVFFCCCCCLFVFQAPLP